MINSRRFTIAVIAGLVPVALMAALAALAPSGAMSLAGDTNSPGFRMHLVDLGIDGLQLSGDTVQGEDVAQIALGELTDSRNLIIERDFTAASLIPGAPVHTIRITMPVSRLDELDLFTRKACLEGGGDRRWSSWHIR